MLKENPTCKICNNIFKNSKSLSRHFHKHNLSSREYYDSFCKNENEGFCLVCNKPTKYKNIKIGYRKYCSYKCMHGDKNFREIVRIKSIETKRNNPEIIKKQIQTYKQTLSTDPAINIRRSENISKTLKENPEIVKNRTVKRLQTEKKTNARKKSGKKAIETKNSLNLWKEIGDKISIAKRKKYNQLKSPNSTVPYFLYLIQHLEKDIIKIGRTNKPRKRLKDIVRDFGPAKIIFTLKDQYNKIQLLESYLHDYFNEYCQVQPSGIGRTEWFNDSILEEILFIID